MLGLGEIESLVVIGGILANTVLAVLGFLHVAGKIEEIHLTMNSRLDQLLAERGAGERAKGVLEGKAAALAEVPPVAEVPPAAWTEIAKPPAPKGKE